MKFSQKILIIIATVLIVKQIDFSDPIRALSVRVTFGLTHLIVFALYFLVYLKVKSVSNDKGREKFGSFLEGGQKAVLFSLIRLFAIICIVCCVHIYIGTFVPLVLQSILNPLGLFENKYFQYFIVKNEKVLVEEEEAAKQQTEEKKEN